MPELARQEDVQFVQLDWGDIDQNRCGRTESLEIHPQFIAPRRYDPDINLGPLILDRGRQILHLGMYGWYVWTTYGDDPLVDGDPESFLACAFPYPKRVVVFDLGESLFLQRIRFYPRARFEDTRYVPRFVIGVDDGDLAPDGTRGYYPEFYKGQGQVVPVQGTYLYGQTLSYDYDIVHDINDNIGVVDLKMPPYPMRRLLFEAPVKERGVWEIAEFEIYGDGYAPQASFVSNIIDLKQAASLGELSWSGRIDPGAHIDLSYRSGDDEDPNIYWRYTFRGEEMTPYDDQGRPLTQATYNRLESGNRAGITYDAGKWRFWSTPFDFDSGRAALIGDKIRRYVQLKADFRSTIASGSRLDYLQLTVSKPPVASQVLAELVPFTVPAGVITSFTYKLRPLLNLNDLGFDSIEIDTFGQVASIDSVRLNGVDVDFAVVRWDDRGFVLRIPRVDVQGTNELIEVVFQAEIFNFGTTFSGRVFDSTHPYEVPQAVMASDADRLVDSNTLSVALSDVKQQTLKTVRLHPAAFTPNGDGINDEIQIEYELLNLSNEASVSMEIYDLSGQKRVRLFQGEKKSGRFKVTWDGRDGQGMRLPPGLYLLHLKVRTNRGRDDIQRIISMVY